MSESERAKVFTLHTRCIQDNNEIRMTQTKDSIHLHLCMLHRWPAALSTTKSQGWLAVWNKYAGKFMSDIIKIYEKLA